MVFRFVSNLRKHLESIMENWKDLYRRRKACCMFLRHRRGSKGTVWLAMPVSFPTEGGRRQMPFASQTLRANVNGRYYRDSSWHGIPTRASFLPPSPVSSSRKFQLLHIKAPPPFSRYYLLTEPICLATLIPPGNAMTWIALTGHRLLTI